MINFDDVTKENMKKNNSNWPQIPDHSYRILVIAGVLDPEKLIRYSI